MGESLAPGQDRDDEDEGMAPDPPASSGEIEPSDLADDAHPSESSEHSTQADGALSWPDRIQEIVIASAGGVGALIAGSVLGGSGSSVESLEIWAAVFCALAGLVTWFLPRPKSNPALIRVGSWATVALLFYWLGPIHIALYRAEHDLAQGTRSEKVAAVDRLVRLGDRDLRGADLRELNLSDANLANVRLENANLSHSMLERTLLIESDLSEAKLIGTNLRGANLSSANLKGAALGEGADSARCDRFTQLPAGFTCYHGAILPGD